MVFCLAGGLPGLSGLSSSFSEPEGSSLSLGCSVVGEGVSAGTLTFAGVVFAAAAAGVVLLKVAAIAWSCLAW